jgi:hypothetical protein
MNKSFQRNNKQFNPPIKTGTQSNKLGLHLHHRQQNRTAVKTQRPKQHIQQTHPAEAKSDPAIIFLQNRERQSETHSSCHHR